MTQKLIKAEKKIDRPYVSIDLDANENNPLSYLSSIYRQLRYMSGNVFINEDEIKECMNKIDRVSLLVEKIIKR